MILGLRRASLSAFVGASPRLCFDGNWTSGTAASWWDRCPSARIWFRTRRCSPLRALWKLLGPCPKFQKSQIFWGPAFPQSKLGPTGRCHYPIKQNILQFPDQSWLRSNLVLSNYNFSAGSFIHSAHMRTSKFLREASGRHNTKNLWWLGSGRIASSISWRCSYSIAYLYY